jgi:hypothetical protein
MHPLIAATAMICLALNAGAAGAINMWYDRDIDAVMKRTKNRPIPLGRMNPDEALFRCYPLRPFRHDDGRGGELDRGGATRVSRICSTCSSTRSGSNAARRKIS